MESETIYALSSGAVRSGVAVIRVSGPDVPTVMAAFLQRPVHSRAFALRAIRDPLDGSVIDRGLVLHFPGPHSYTGEESVEFQVHGSLAIIRHMLARLGGIPGVRAALPGEFTHRAWLNGRMDLLEVESLADTLAAETEVQRKLAMEGSRWLRQQADTWREKLLTMRAMIEAEIDFADEGDVQARLDSDAERIGIDLVAELRTTCSSLRRGRSLRNGFRVAILGSPNAGKSSLMNALADRDVAIASPQPGTTRDVVESVIDLGGLPVILMDTAGLRENVSDPIEAEGMARSRRAADGADLVIWASPVDSPTEPPSPLYLVVHTKADLAEPAWDRPFSVSVLTGAGMDSLAKEIQARAGLSGGLAIEGVIVHERHALCLENAALALERSLAHPSAALDLRAEELRLACQSIDMLVGRLSPDDVLGAIFSRFCVGK